MKKSNSIPILFSLLLLQACSVTPEQCNSSNADVSLIGKMHCDYSGGYSHQVREREQDLVRAQAENAMFHQVYQDITAQQNATRLSLNEQKQQQDKLNRSLNKLLSELRGRHSDKALVQQQLTRLEQDLAAASEVSGGQNPAELAARKAELEMLQQQVNRLQFSLGYE